MTSSPFSEPAMVCSECGKPIEDHGCGAEIWIRILIAVVAVLLLILGLLWMPPISAGRQ